MPVRTATTSAVALLVVLLLAGCGQDGEPATDRTTRPVHPDGPSTIPASELGKTYFGQEVWLTYQSPPHAHFGRRMNRTRGEAERLARDLKRRVEQGERIGAIARELSNAPGAMADGYFPVPLVRQRAIDHRDRAVMAASDGELTPILDWKGGFWFARRVNTATGMGLKTKFETMAAQRVKIRSIYVAHTGLDDDIRKFDTTIWRTHFEALRHAEKILKKALAGENFASLVKAHSENKATRADGGLVWQPRAGKPRDYKDYWLRWGELYVPSAVLEAAFATQPGDVFPKVIDVPKKGLFLIQTVDVKLR